MATTLPRQAAHLDFGGVEGYKAKTTCTGFVVSPDGYVVAASHRVHTGPHGGAGLLFDAVIEDLRAVEGPAHREPLRPNEVRRTRVTPPRRSTR